MGLVWPWSIMEPGHPFQALTYFSHFFEKPWKEMFEGALVSVPTCRGRICRRCSRCNLPEVLLGLLAAGVVDTFNVAVAQGRASRRKTILLMLTSRPRCRCDRNGEAARALQRHPAFHFRDPPMTVLAVSRRMGNELAESNKRSWQPAVLAVFAFGCCLPLGEMIRLHPYQYAHFNHLAGTVRSADNLFTLTTGSLAEAGFGRPARELSSARRCRRWGASGKLRCAVRSDPRRSRSVSDFTIGWDSSAADFAMTLGEFYCKGLTAPVMVEIKRDDVVFARVYDIRAAAYPACWRSRRRNTKQA